MKKSIVTAALALTIMSGTAFADSAGINTTIEKVLVNDGTIFGGCMALLADSPKNYLSSCGTWVTFSCTGDFASVLQANNMLDTAKMAYALDKEVYITFTDTKMHNGFCFANRIDLL